MASSFYVGKDKPNLTVRPDDWSTPAKRKYSGGVGTEGVIVEAGVTRIEIPFYSNKITMVELANQKSNWLYLRLDY